MTLVRCSTLPPVFPFLPMSAKRKYSDEDFEIAAAALLKRTAKEIGVDPMSLAKRLNLSEVLEAWVRVDDFSRDSIPREEIAETLHRVYGIK